jgi:hypothetical protein
MENCEPTADITGRAMLSCIGLAALGALQRSMQSAREEGLLEFLSTSVLRAVVSACLVRIAMYFALCKSARLWAASEYPRSCPLVKHYGCVTVVVRFARFPDGTSTYSHKSKGMKSFSTFTVHEGFLSSKGRSMNGQQSPIDGTNKQRPGRVTVRLRCSHLSCGSLPYFSSWILLSVRRSSVALDWHRWACRRHIAQRAAGRGHYPPLISSSKRGG